MDVLSNELMNTVKKAILVTSFGTTYNENRVKTIDALEALVQERFPDWEVRRAFTSKMVIRRLKERDGTEIDYVSEAMDKLSREGFQEVVVQPTHIVNGKEYDDVVRIVDGHVGEIRSLRMSRPLLTSSEDYDRVVKVVEDTLLPKLSPQGALVLMGHGSVHYANASYCQLQMKFWSAGHRNVFVTTGEGYPNFEETLGFMRDGEYRDVLVYPLMLVAGDHANNDMAGDEEDSLKSVLTAAGYDVSCIVRGMGECPHFRELFLDHITDAVRKSEVECQDGGCGASVGKTEVLVDHL